MEGLNAPQPEHPARDRRGAELLPLRTRIGRRVLASFLVCAVVPTAVLAAYSANSVRHDLVLRARSALRTWAEDLAMQTYGRLLLLESTLKQQPPEVTDEQLDRLVERTVDFEGFRAFATVLRADRSGAVLGASSGLAAHERAATSSAIPSLSADARDRLAEGLSLLHVDGARTPRVGPAGAALQPDVWMVVPHGDERLWARLDPHHLWRPANLAATSSMLIYTTSDQVVHVVDPDGAPSPEDRRVSGYGDLEWVGRDGEAYLGSSWRLFMEPRFGTSWTFVYSQPRSTVLAPATQTVTQLVLVVLAVLGIAYMVSVAHLRRLLVPVEELRTATLQARSRDYSTRAEVDSGDELEQLAASFNDMMQELQVMVAERDVREEELRHARDAALESARLETEFIQNVSHELRTPMTSIRAAAEIVRQFGGEDPEAQGEFLEIIVLESERLAKLIEDVLDLGRMQSGEQAWDFAACAPGDGVRDVVRSLVPFASTHEVTIEAEISEDSCLIWGDDGALRRVWLNLISNAVKFTPAGARVLVRARSEGGVFVFEVQDEGPGIRAEDHARIFERFRQSTHDHTTDKPQGTGLGLTIVRDIVQAHRGEVSVESEFGHGATFRVRLPTGVVASDGVPGPERPSPDRAEPASI
jgi:signal transduction histidine kinase